MATNAEYAVGRGKPPAHTRFKKGQSGNPGGKPGPAKLLKARFQRALYEALEKKTMDVALAKPENALASVARQLTLDAMAGSTGAQRLMLSLLDAEIARDETNEVETVERLPAGGVEERNEAQTFSLVQGKKQGSVEKRAHEILDALEAETIVKEAQAEAGKRMGEARKAADTEPRAAPLVSKLLQGTAFAPGRKE